jgi:hypothetical protein
MLCGDPAIQITPPSFAVCEHNFRCAWEKAMNSTRSVRAAVLATMMSAVLVGCGGGGGDSNGDDPNSFKAPLSGGIWHGQDPLTDQNLYGIVNESGAFVFLREDGVLYAGTATFDKRSVVGTFEGFAPANVKFDAQSDSSSHGTGSVSGVLDPQTTLDLAVAFATDLSNGHAENGVLNLTYDKLYERDASLFNIAGNYGANGLTAISIATDGKVFAQGADNCVINGTATVDNPQENSYSMSISYANCTGGSTSLNGVTLKGLVTLDNTKSPERLIGAVSATGTAPMAIVLTLDRV